MENNELVQPAAEALTPESAAPVTGVQQTEQDVALQEEQAVEQGFRPNKKQTAVAVLFVVAGVLSMINIVAMIDPFNGLRIVFALSLELLFLLGWLLLSFMAVNKGVKVGAIVGVCLQLLSFVSSAIPSLGMNKFVSVVFVILQLFGFCYCIGLIQNNGGVKGRIKAWVSLLAVYYALFSSITFSVAFYIEGWVNQHIDLVNSNIGHFYVSSSYYSLWFMLMKVLTIFAYWKLARCEAFSGKYDAEVVPNFSPLNKWMVMALVVPIVIVVALVVIYSNYSWFI